MVPIAAEGAVKGERKEMDRANEMLDSWCEAKGIEFISQEAEEAYKKRARRVADVIQLKVPDRVP
ncbi:MAG: hypothetical protein H6Q48_530, partial [Deltaproteobacteria bacterium]|nr:hypothetical protein [Deltaproteobacteria bacterium]